MTSLLPRNPPTDPAARLDVVVRRYTDLLVATEAQQRTMLRLSLEPGDEERSPLPLRQGRVIAWLHDALDPLRGSIGDDELHRLVLAIRSATGIEALVWLTDIGRLSRREAVDVMRWSAAAMFRSALADGGPAPRAGSAKRGGARPA